jgi:hypothetical protein
MRHNGKASFYTANKMRLNYSYAREELYGGNSTYQKKKNLSKHSKYATG